MPIHPLRRCSLVDAADRQFDAIRCPEAQARAQQSRSVLQRCRRGNDTNQEGLGGHGADHGVALSPPSPSALSLILADTSWSSPWPATLMANGAARPRCRHWHRIGLLGDVSVGRHAVRVGQLRHRLDQHLLEFRP